MTLKICLLLICFITTCFSGSGGRTRSKWEYETQHNWPQSCRGQFQSPIDLPDICYPKSDITIDRNLRYDPKGYNRHLPHRKMRLLNNGHTVSMTIDGWDYESYDAPSVSLSAAGSRSQYQFSELHFHWATSTAQGSEHSIAGTRKAFEMHLVHFNKRYESKKVASDKPDGLLVLGVLFHEDTRENPSLDPIVDQIQYVRRTNNSAPARRAFSLQSILPPDTSIFYLYKGSLTTPPCSESVTWLIIAEVQKIGYSQLKEFQRMDNAVDRDRDIQERNGRPIYANSNDHCGKDPDQGSGDDRPSSGGDYGSGSHRPGSGSRPPGNGDEYGSSGLPEGQGTGTGYGSDRPQTGYPPGSWGSGRPSQGTGGDGYGSTSSSSSGGYHPSSSGGSRPQGSTGGIWGSGGYDEYGSGGSSGSRPDSAYASGSGSSGSRPGYGYNSGRPSSGQNGHDYSIYSSGSRSTQRHNKNQHSVDRITGNSRDSSVVYPG